MWKMILLYYGIKCEIKDLMPRKGQTVNEKKMFLIYYEKP